MAVRAFRLSRKECLSESLINFGAATHRGANRSESGTNAYRSYVNTTILPPAVLFSMTR
jgi:hypothetical protein